MAKKQTPLKNDPVENFRPGDYIAEEHGGVKPGGQAGQMLKKASDTDFDTIWGDAVPEQPMEPEIFDAGLNIVTGKHAGYSIVNKFGRRVSMNLSDIPQDVWDVGGVYTGFPATGLSQPIDPLEFQVVSTNNDDRGELVIQYLEDEFSEAYKVLSVQVDGTTPVNTGVFGIRMHTARYNNDSPIKFNLGEIIVRHKEIPQNVFCAMPPGRSQTACAAITVPANHTGYIVRLFARVYGNPTADTLQGMTAGSLSGFSLSGDGGSLVYTGLHPKTFLATYSASFTFAEAVPVWAYLQQSGSAKLLSRTRALPATAGNTVNVSGQTILTITTGQTVSLFFVPTAHSGTDALTVFEANLTLTEIE